MNILNMSLTAATMAVMAILIRIFFVGRLPKLTFVFIWGLIVARLLVPFDVPVWLNPLNAFSRFWQAAVPNTVELSARTVGWHVLQGGVPTYIESSGRSLIPEILFIIWMVGTVGMALYVGVNHYKFRRKIADALLVENVFVTRWLTQHQADMLRKLEVRISDKISSPLAYGLFEPVIVLPKAMDWTDESKLSNVLTHEYIHIRHFHYALKICMVIALCIHWFNPLIWLMHLFASRDIELSCDESALKLLGKNSKSTYAKTLIDMAESQNNFILLASSFSKNAIEERVKVMINMKRTSILGAILAVGLVGGTMLVSASDAPETDVEDHVEEVEVQMSITGNSDDHTLEVRLDGESGSPEEQGFIGGIIETEEEFLAWSEQRLEILAASGDYAEESMELFRQEHQRVLESIRVGHIVSIYENEELGFTITSIGNPEYTDVTATEFSMSATTTLTNEDGREYLIRLP